MWADSFDEGEHAQIFSYRSSATAGRAAVTIGERVREHTRECGQLQGRQGGQQAGSVPAGRPSAATLLRTQRIGAVVTGGGGFELMCDEPNDPDSVPGNGGVVRAARPVRTVALM